MPLETVEEISGSLDDWPNGSATMAITRRFCSTRTSLGGGRRLRVESDIDTEDLARILDVLERRRFGSERCEGVAGDGLYPLLNRPSPVDLPRPCVSR